MSLARIRPALLAVLAALLLAAGLAPAQANASEDSGTASEAATITTVLHPGWNMVGWVGPATPTSELFEELPALRRVSAWDAGENAYLRAFRGRHNELPSLTTGVGLWLHLGGDAAVEWTRPVSGEAVLLSLRTGQNLVGWTGEDGTPIADAVGRFGDAFVRAWRWDAQAQRYDHYRPGRDDTNTLAELQRGDALWVNLTSEARWWQPGVARPRFEFTEDVPAEERQAVREALESARAVFAERFGVYTADFDVYLGADRCHSGSSITLTRTCGSIPWIVAHEYFHVLQSHTTPGAHGPTWLVEGSANYAHTVYGGVVDQDSTADEFLRKSRWSSIIQLARATVELSTIETYADFHAVDAEPLNYELGFLAADWLAGRAGEISLIEYYRLLASHDSWESAFESAFDIGLADFYPTFEAYRSEVAPPLPHLTDDAVRPVVVFLGDVPAEVGTAFKSEVDSVHTFLSERFGARGTEYTLYLGANPEAAEATYERLVRSERGGCSVSSAGWIVHVLPCEHDLTASTYIGISFSSLFHDHAYGDHPLWLIVGGQIYVKASYRAADDSAWYADEARRHAEVTSQSPIRLHQLVDGEGWNAIGYDKGSSLAFLAVDWLTRRAGDRALFEYHGGLPPRPPRYQDPDPWQDAFEQAFGLTIEDFYEQFEAYRASLVTR